MVRSMYSGVAGMRSHQQRMDVIGNNIANVNTYGFKASRMTFRDMYYQTLRGAAAATANRGGLNPSSIGYGSQIGSVDLLMTQSSFTSTGNPLDLAIAGEGFFQVMDNDGNIFYTKAGMLDIDSAGNLIDTNGYFVLGTSGNPLGQVPGSNKIQFNIPSVAPSNARVTEAVHGVRFSIAATNQTKEGNVSFVFESKTDMPIGKKVNVILDGGTITVQLNAKENFATLADLGTLVNTAITEANSGLAHPAGNFTFQLDPTTSFPTGGLTGAEICGAEFGYKKGSVTVPTGLFGGFTFVEVGNLFNEGDGNINYEIDYNATTEVFTIKATTGGAGGQVYEADIHKSQMESPGTVVLFVSGGNLEDSITLTYPTAQSVLDFATPSGGTSPVFPLSDTGLATSSVKSKDLGLGARNFKLTGGHEGGAQTIKDLTGITIGADGTVVATHGVHGRLTIGRIDLANFDNPRGLIQTGDSYFAATLNSGNPDIGIAGEGGIGALQNSALEMSNVDLSQEFADMIVTQRGFQANSRLITVSDTMLEELINLKR